MQGRGEGRVDTSIMVKPSLLLPTRTHHRQATPAVLSGGGCRGGGGGGGGGGCVGGGGRGEAAHCSCDHGVLTCRVNWRVARYALH